MYNVTEEEKIGIITGKLLRVCSKCGCEVVFDDELVTKGYDEILLNYDCACLVCDEDLDLWETKVVPKEEVRMFITSEDKEHYKTYGHLPTEKLDEFEKKYGDGA